MFAVTKAACPAISIPSTLPPTTISPGVYNLAPDTDIVQNGNIGKVAGVKIGRAHV